MGADDGDDGSMMMTMMIMVMGMLFMHTERPSELENGRASEEVRGKCERVQRSVGYVKVWKQWFQRIMQISIVFV